MTTRQLVFFSAAALASTVTTLANPPTSGVICAGAARLDPGSLITLGQPFVGVMSAPGGSVTLHVGIVPVLETIRNSTPTGPLRIAPDFGMVDGRFRFRFPSQCGGHYVIEASTNLVDWTPLLTTNATDWSVTFEDLDARRSPWRFYRLSDVGRAVRP
jgi:hypothetical protein